MLFIRKRYMCVLCNCYRDEANIDHTYKGIGICKECHNAIKTAGDYTYQARPPIIALISPFEYDGLTKRSVKRLKFSAQKGYGAVFGKLLAEELNNHPYLDGYDCIIPVPLHGTRLRERGYNQAEMIASAFANEIGLPCITDAVFRVRKTKRQSSLRGIERVENVKAAFYASESQVRDKNIILVDDISTRGETLLSCAKALKDAGANRIIAVSLCKTAHKERSMLLR